MNVYGYAQSVTQSGLESQTQRLNQAGISASNLFFDTVGSIVGLSKLKAKVRSGDVIYVCHFHQIGRNTVDMIATVKEFDDQGVGVTFLHDELDTVGPEGKTVLKVLLAIRDSERRRIVESMNSGRAQAIAGGVKLGRKPKIDKNKVIKLYNDGLTAIEISKRLQIGRSTVYKLLEDES